MINMLHNRQISSEENLVGRVVEAFHAVIQLPNDITPYKFFDTLEQQKEIGVLISMTGQLSPRILIVGDQQTFEKLGLAMFGMSLEGETLLSFIGEIGNMIAGNACSILSKEGVTIDITAPTVMTGQYTVSGFNRGIAVSIIVRGVGQITLNVLLRDM